MVAAAFWVFNWAAIWIGNAEAPVIVEDRNLPSTVMRTIQQLPPRDKAVA